jgi:hypothetical protein
MFAGETSVGADGAVNSVENENGAEKELVPPAFVALTRQ